MVRWSVPKDTKSPLKERDEMLDFVLCFENTMKEYALTKSEAIWLLLMEYQ